MEDKDPATKFVRTPMGHFTVAVSLVTIHQDTVVVVSGHIRPLYAL